MEYNNTHVRYETLTTNSTHFKNNIIDINIHYTRLLFILSNEQNIMKYRNTVFNKLL